MSGTTEKTIDNEIEDDSSENTELYEDNSIDYRSFIDIHEENIEDDGLVTLKNIEKVNEYPSVLSEYIQTDKAYKIESDEANIYLSTDKTTREWDIIEAFTGNRNVRYLGGSEIPITEVYTIENAKNVAYIDVDLDTKHIHNGEYFDTNSDNQKSKNNNENKIIDPELIREYIYKGYITYNNKEWRYTQRFERINNKSELLEQNIDELSTYIIITSLIGLFIPYLYPGVFILFLSWIVFSTLGILVSYGDTDRKEKILNSIYK